jgi:hypothetical protein
MPTGWWDGTDKKMRSRNRSVSEADSRTRDSRYVVYSPDAFVHQGEIGSPNIPKTYITRIDCPHRKLLILSDDNVGSIKETDATTLECRWNSVIPAGKKIDRT